MSRFQKLCLPQLGSYRDGSTSWNRLSLLLCRSLPDRRSPCRRLCTCHHSDPSSLLAEGMVQSGFMKLHTTIILQTVFIPVLNPVTIQEENLHAFLWLMNPIRYQHIPDMTDEVSTYIRQDHRSHKWCCWKSQSLARQWTANSVCSWVSHVQNSIGVPSSNLIHARRGNCKFNIATKCQGEIEYEYACKFFSITSACDCRDR